jgi:hypothetical protein
MRPLSFLVFIALNFVLEASSAFDLSRVVFVVMSQTGRRHVTIANETRSKF